MLGRFLSSTDGLLQMALKKQHNKNREHPTHMSICKEREKVIKTLEYTGTESTGTQVILTKLHARVLSQDPVDGTR